MEIYQRDGGLSLGYGVKRPLRPFPDGLGQNPLNYTGERNILCYGGIGAGKTRRLAKTALLKLRNWSHVFLDFKGDITANTWKYRQAIGNEVVIFNPFGVGGLPSNGYNPISALNLNSKEFADDLTNIIMSIIRDDGTRDHYWTDSAQEVGSVFGMYSRLIGENGGSLAHIRSLLSQPHEELQETIDAILDFAAERNFGELEIRAGRFRNTDAKENKETRSVVNTALSKMRWLSSDYMRDEVSEGDFNFASMKQRPTTCYIVLPAKYLGSHASWVTMLITAFLQAALGSIDDAKVPVLLTIDEAAQIGSIPLLNSSITLLRQFGVKVMQLYTDLPSHKHIVGDLYESAIANSTVVAFAPQDMTTARMLSERSGQTTAEIYSVSGAASLFRGEAGEPSISMGYQSVPALLPQNLMNMDPGFAIIYSDALKGPVFSYLPDPTEIPAYEKILRHGR